MSNMNEDRRRLLLIVKYGKIAFSPAYKHKDGLVKLIVMNPDNEVMINNTNHYYTMLQILMSHILAEHISEEDKMNASICFKDVKFNDTMYIDEKDVYEEVTNNMTIPPEVDDDMVDEYIGAKIMTDSSYIIPIPIIL
ncbi:MAG: hypothetical protein IKR19_08530 [Acholeplasmatales bacterium]|nr:hypothetical protein [Acholeplasmatales bacterium]